MRNYFSLLFVVGLIGLIGCKSETVSISQRPVLTPPTVTTPANLFNAPDSIDAYRPTFGGANTVLQAPFGLAKQPASTLRLVSVLYSGMLNATYQYDEQGRLTQQTNYYTYDIHVSDQYTYSYGPQGLTRISRKTNKDDGLAKRGFSPPTNELLPASTSTFTPYLSTQAWVDRSTLTTFSSYSGDLGKTNTWLGFDAKGALVWEETIDKAGRSTEYSLYRRDQAGNVVFYRHALPFNQWDAQSMTYDDKPNPYYTVGDTQSMVGSSPNNIVSVTDKSGHIIWQYVHTYRPDGYPSQTKCYRYGELFSTYEYTYNQ